MQSGILLPATATLIAVLALHAAMFLGIKFYAAVFLLSSGIYLWLGREITRKDLPEPKILMLLGAALLVRASFLLANPLGSDDVFRYLWDGKVQAAGIDPYAHAPGAPELAHLKSDLLPASVNHPEMPTVYFPVSQWIFFLSYSLAGEAVWGIKLFLLIAEVFTVSALWHVTRLSGSRPASVLLYALCPLPIVQFAFDAHLDGIGVALLACSVLCRLKRHRVPAFLLLGLSLAIKPVGLVLIPIWVMAEKSWRNRLMALLIPLIPFALQFLPHRSSPTMLAGLMTFSRHWTFNGVAFEMVNAILDNNLPSRLVCAGLLATSLVLLYWSSLGEQRKMYCAVLLLLLFSPVVHPWYICWLLVFLPPLRPGSGIVFAATASLTVFTIVSYQTSGIWAQYPLALIGEYAPVIVLFAMELRGWRREARPA